MPPCFLQNSPFPSAFINWLLQSKSSPDAAMGIPTGACEPQRGSSHRSRAARGDAALAWVVAKSREWVPVALGCSQSCGVLTYLRVVPQSACTPHGTAVLRGSRRPCSSETCPSSGTGRFTHERWLLCRTWRLWAYGLRHSLCTPTDALHSPGKVTSPLIKGFNNIYLIGVNNGPQDAVRIN